MKFEEFINKYVNTNVDFDGVYGAQCVDLFRQYCKDVLDIPHTGSVEGAKDLVLNYKKLPAEMKYFYLLQTFQIRTGDVIVWNGTNTNKYGHVAIVVGILSDSILILEQNGFKQDGVRFNCRTFQNCLGILRFKGVIK